MGRTARTQMKISPRLKKLLPRQSWKIPSTTAEILPLQTKLRPILKRAWPEGSEKDISWFSADLAGLWEVSRVHIILVRKLLKAADKLDKAKLQQLSQELDVNWFSNAPGYLETMKKELARFKASLYGYDRKRPKHRRHR
jgi:hypothetical protein